MYGEKSKNRLNEAEKGLDASGPFLKHQKIRLKQLPVLFFGVYPNRF